MIKSMTGYGKAEALLQGGRLTVEIRTLNSKSCDINIKTSLLPKDKELTLRQKIADKLTRGTIDIYVGWEPNAGASTKQISSAAVGSYIKQISDIAYGLGCSSLMDDERALSVMLSAVLRFPDVVDQSRTDVINDDNWPDVDAAFDRALDQVNDYRSREGEVLYKDVTSRVAVILELEKEIESHEAERLETVRTKILKNAEDLQLKLDTERFEQEMVFYLEKMDINEEKVRLRQHCAYFMDTIDGEACPGKKLGFIIQEMGREINTTGSKANHAMIQGAVVRMKDELEKIREQSMNIL